MVFITPFIGAAALLSGFAAALPRPDSSINEPAVSAPDGTPITAGSSPMATPMNDSSCGSSGCGSNKGMMDAVSSSTMMSETSTSTMMHDVMTTTSTAMAYAMTTSSSMMSETSTVMASSNYGSSSYGSGSMNWNMGSSNSGFNDCVNQCVAKFGSTSTATYQATATQESVSGSGSGATHTVIVAPTQGVLRYIPFAVNASVGDTIKFMWGANNHTVTKSSSLLPCNRSADALFTSGTQNQGFTFTQVVNDTNPTFFYCATPTHCQKGMFGIVNPPNALGAPSSVGSMLPMIAANNSNVAAYSAATSSMMSSGSAASKWGANIDIASMPEWSHEFIAENVLYTRQFLASNSEVLKDDGSVDLSAAGTTPLMIPSDLSVALASPSTAAAPTVAATVEASATPTPSSLGTGAAENLKSGALSMTSSKVLVSLVAAFATFMML